MTGKRFENRLCKENKKFNTLNPVWDNEKRTGLNVFEMIDELNELNDENQAIQRKVFKLMDWLETEKGISKEEVKRWWND